MNVQSVLSRMSIFLNNKLLVGVTLFTLAVILAAFLFKPHQGTGRIAFPELPEGVVFIEHPEDERIAREKGGVAMKHYATPEALAAGGPIYGVLGYSIVSIEYEIPLDKIGARPVGEPDDPGMLLNIEDFAKQENIPYDHFHIGTAHAHGGTREEHTDDHDHDHNQTEEEVLLIHFMLIPHETAVAYGLTCS